jgi:hypothetical protein
MREVPIYDSVRHSMREHHRPELNALGPLDDLLVDRLRRVVHDHCPILVVDLGIHARVTNQVDNPLLALVRIEAKTGRQVPTKSDQNLPKELASLT